MSFKLSYLLKVTVLCLVEIILIDFTIRGQTYHTSNIDILVNNSDANQKRSYGTYDFQIANGTGNTNFPVNGYGNLVNFNSVNFVSQFLTTHGSNPELFFRVLYNAGGWTQWRKAITEHDNRVGIGTPTPENSEGWMKVLEVKGAAHSKSLVSTNNVISGLWSHELGYYGAPAGGISGTYTNHPFSFVTNKISRMTITNDGRVGIGISAPPSNYKLAVAGNIIAEQVRVKLQSSGWPDYVFKPEYKLMPLTQVENFIKKNGHLPEVPQAEEVAKEGIELGANQALLLRKIEEMTLHLISINKRVEDLEAENKLLKKQLEKALVK